MRRALCADGSDNATQMEKNKSFVSRWLLLIVPNGYLSSTAVKVRRARRAIIVRCWWDKHAAKMHLKWTHVPKQNKCTIWHFIIVLQWCVRYFLLKNDRMPRIRTLKSKAITITTIDARLFGSILSVALVCSPLEKTTGILHVSQVGPECWLRLRDDDSCRYGRDAAAEPLSPSKSTPSATLFPIASFENAHEKLLN